MMELLQSRFPRLPRPVALALHRDLVNKESSMWEKGLPIPRMEHPRHIVPTTVDKVSDGFWVAFRAGVMEELDVSRSVGPNSPVTDGELDRVVGRHVFERLRLSPVEASDEGLWAFITLLVLPDLLYWRFPKLSLERALGGKRNFVRRNWERQSVLGSIYQSSQFPLGEDELVGLFERSRLSRNRQLVVVIAKHLQALSLGNRSLYARRLMAEVGRESGTLLLDGLDEHELEAVVDYLGARVA